MLMVLLNLRIFDRIIIPHNIPRLTSGSVWAPWDAYNVDEVQFLARIMLSSYFYWVASGSVSFCVPVSLVWHWPVL